MFIYLLFLAGSLEHPLQASSAGVHLPHSRAISLVPAVTEIIYALEAQDKLVGVAAPCDYPPDIHLPVVGNFSVPKIERLVALSPDIVFVTGGEQKYLWERLKSIGINIFIVDPKNLEEIYSSIIDIGKLLAKEEKADSVVRKMRNDFMKLPQKGSGIPPCGGTDLPPPGSGRSPDLPHKRTVYIEISDIPLITCGKGSFIDELITLAEGINIAGKINKEYPVISSEFVVKKNPDVIIVLHPGSSPKDRLGWQNITAVKERRIYKDIDPNIVERPGPRIIKGIEALKRRIYPELFK